jgi:lysine N6-hydroxylase
LHNSQPLELDAIALLSKSESATCTRFAKKDTFTLLIQHKDRLSCSLSAPELKMNKPGWSANGEQMHYQCVGIGVGPSNLSVASLLYGKENMRSIFFDKKTEFSWHDGMLVPGAGLQVSLFKDLVTLADPTNRFSFIAYLHENRKLYHFLNARFEHVPRVEFRNYLKWVSESNESINFGEKVLRVDFATNFIVETTKRQVTAENVVVGVGTEPVIPDFCSGKLGDSLFHVSELTSKSRKVAGKHVTVVGGGQSGAEAFLDLISREPHASPQTVNWLSRRENFFPLDDSPFTNEYFMPGHSDYFFEQESAYRTSFIRRNVLGSDGISESTLRQIYQRVYMLRYVESRGPRVSLMPDRSVHHVARVSDKWNLVVRHRTSSLPESVAADVVILATGFRGARMDFLAPLHSRFERDCDEFKIDSDFSVIWDGPPNRRIFLLNAARQQRGLPDPNLSLTAWRSQRVIDCIRGIRRAYEPQASSFVTWSSSASPISVKREIAVGL